MAELPLRRFRVFPTGNFFSRAHHRFGNLSNSNDMHPNDLSMGKIPREGGEKY
jgi:hypothetical protein